MSGNTADAHPSKRPVVVGLHDSKNSLAALRRAVDVAVSAETGIHIVYVVPGGSAEDAATGGEAMVSAAVSKLFPDGLPVPGRVSVERGDPAQTLVRLSADAERLVIGACNHAHRRGIFAGDIVRFCMKHAACPVDVCADHGTEPA